MRRQARLHYLAGPRGPERFVHSQGPVRLKAAYEQAGIPEYWLVDARADAISFQILTLVNAAYVASLPPDQPQISRVLGARFELRRARNRLGRFTYTLEIT